MQLSLLQKSLISFALIVTFGVLIHDTKIDQATALALTLPVVGLTVAAHLPGLTESESHTHIEKAAFNQFVTGNHRVQVRDDNRRYLLTKHILGDNTPDTHTLVFTPAYI